MRDKLFHSDENYIERMNSGEDKPHEFANRIIEQNQGNNTNVDGVIVVPTPEQKESENGIPN